MGSFSLVQGVCLKAMHLFQLTFVLFRLGSTGFLSGHIRTCRHGRSCWITEQQTRHGRQCWWRPQGGPGCAALGDFGRFDPTYLPGDSGDLYPLAVLCPTQPNPHWVATAGKLSRKVPGREQSSADTVRQLLLAHFPKPGCTFSPGQALVPIASASLGPGHGTHLLHAAYKSERIGLPSTPRPAPGLHSPCQVRLPRAEGTAGPCDLRCSHSHPRSCSAAQWLLQG